MKICHNNYSISLSAYGPFEKYCDSIDVKFVAPVSLYDTTARSYYSEFSFYNKTPRVYYFVNDGIVDSLAFAFRNNDSYTWIKDLSLSDNEVQDIQKMFCHYNSDTVYKNMKGALLITSIRTTNVRKTTPRYNAKITYKNDIIENHISSFDGGYDYDFIYSPPTEYDDIIWNIKGWIHSGISKNNIPVYTNINTDSIYSVFKTEHYHDGSNSSFCLFELSPLDKPDNKLEVNLSSIKLNKYTRNYDLSQESIDISFDIDPTLRKHIKIKQLIIPFDYYSEFTYIFPTPDSIGEKLIYYSTPQKIQQINTTGFHTFVKYPERQNEQTARIFVLTMILTLIVTWIINQNIQLVKNSRIRNKFVNRTNQCAMSVINCTDCPLKTQCEHINTGKAPFSPTFDTATNPTIEDELRDNVPVESSNNDIQDQNSDNHIEGQVTPLITKRKSKTKNKKR